MCDHAKRVSVSVSCEIKRIAYLGHITNSGSGRAQKLQMERSRECRDISVRDWGREKGNRLRIARNRPCSIFRPKTNIGSSHMRKLLKERSREYRDTSLRDWAREKDCHLKIVRRHKGSIFRPKNEHWKQSQWKIRKRALPRGPRY